jgi:hypothetical protein
MNTRRIIVVLMVACLPAVLIAALPAPTGLSVTVGSSTVDLDWDDVVGAAKYSVDIEGTVTYTDAILGEVTADVEVSFGTSDRTDGGDMADSDLTITIDDLALAIATELGISTDDLDSLDGSAKVKALDPGKGAGSQNNPFSDPVELDVTF